MKPIIVGLGSMGKRRIRCLQALGCTDITGFDVRSDRREEAVREYGIAIADTISPRMLGAFDTAIISVPPDRHNQYIRMAIDAGIPAFVEASVIREGLPELAKSSEKKGVLIAPSCTMLFHPAIRDVLRIVRSKEYGDVTNFSYHSGQFLPDWHPWERVSDYYVSRRETGGCREIVPFELTWIVDLMSIPNDIRGFFGMTTDVGAPIDDTYSIAMAWEHAFGTLTVDVVSRYATRSLIMNLEEGQVLWNWDERRVKVYDARAERWVVYHEPEGQSRPGYNRNIRDGMYIDELRSYLDAAAGSGEFPNTLRKDIAVLDLLGQVEEQR